MIRKGTTVRVVDLYGEIEDVIGRKVEHGELATVLSNAITIGEGGPRRAVELHLGGVCYADVNGEIDELDSWDRNCPATRKSIREYKRQPRDSFGSSLWYFRHEDAVVRGVAVAS